MKNNNEQTVPKPEVLITNNDNSGDQSEGDQLIQIFNKSFSMSFIGEDIDNDYSKIL